jgi:hypothetical protein
VQASPYFIFFLFPVNNVFVEAEGARRSVCDMVLLIFHLVLSGFTYDGVDIKIAEKILNWNLQRFPDGL